MSVSTTAMPCLATWKLKEGSGCSISAIGWGLPGARTREEIGTAYWMRSPRIGTLGRGWTVLLHCRTT